ncbi:Tripartite ATP-independent transporter, DctM component [Lutimaribacter pacificus]|uniref:Tripartite ATP-independent transporter, DctM component n=2 Tax=Lutimaribacter pacificus TaxID=391948 RepID=A0A1H0ITA3_9RHOB|nr:Tripartite ATP-independent transporter, DctM component [Lutimaribacter pacificus]SHK17801.1 Tripartite ATP-independent transporter, DctM component [Lutimaribacter pacificus]
MIGVIAALVLETVQRSPNLAAIQEALTDGAPLTTMLFLIIVGGTLFTWFLVQTGFVQAITG